MRSVIWSEEFSRQVEESGGARLFDRALGPIIDGLTRNPYGFHKFENDHVSFRYARTLPIRDEIGALVIVFTIDEDKNVVLQHFEEDLQF